MYTILDEVHTMSLEVNILQHQIGIVGVLPKRGTENGTRTEKYYDVYRFNINGTESGTKQEQNK